MRMPREMKDRILALAGHTSKGVVIPAGEVARLGLERPVPGGPTRFGLSIVGWQPTTLNRLMKAHFATAARLKAADAETLWVACRQAGVPSAVAPRVRRRVSLEIMLGPRQRGPDKDAWWKSSLDGLVRCGALADDSDRWCQLGTIEYVRGPAKGTLITLEDLEG